MAAGGVALSSVADPRLREARPTEEDLDPDRGAGFTETQEQRSEAYRRPAYAAFLASLVLQVLTLLVVARSVLPVLVSAMEARDWPFPLVALATGAALATLLFLFALPVAFVRGYVIEHAWGLSTSSLPGWISDRARSLLVGATVSGVTALVFFGLMRWKPGSWWVWTWALFSGLTLFMAYIWPVAVAPLFNRFVPLEDGALRARIERLAEDAEVSIRSVLVADASRRTRAENAYVAGVGASRRIVLYDTLLEEAGQDQTLFVVAHELGHEKERHVLVSVGLSSLGLLVGSLALWSLRGWEPLWRWAGAGGISDLRAASLLAALALVASVLSAPISNSISRRFERDSDDFAVELTGDPEAGVAAFRRLALKNISDLAPPRILVWFAFTHPPIVERIRELSLPRTTT